MSYALKKKKKSGDTTVGVARVQKMFTGVRAIKGQPCSGFHFVPSQDGTYLNMSPSKHRELPETAKAPEN